MKAALIYLAESASTETRPAAGCAPHRERLVRRFAGVRAGRATVGCVASAPCAAPWQPERPRLRVRSLLAAWLVVRARPAARRRRRARGRHPRVRRRVLVAAVVAVLNAMLPPVVAALRLPFTVAIGFVLVLALDAAILLLAADVAPEQLYVDDFWAAVAVAVIAAAISMAVGAVMGVDDDDGYTLRVARRVARRTGKPIAVDAPGILFLEIDGLALPVLRRAIRDGTTPNMARWLADGSHACSSGRPTCRRRPGASQAGILLGDNEDIPAFRWVDKATGHAGHLLEPRRLRGDRARARRRPRAAGRRRDEPRQPALGRAPRPPSSRSAGCPRRSRRIPATARSWPTAPTSPGRSCSRFGSCGSSWWPRHGSAGATCARAGTAAAAIRSSAPGCASSSGT